jgi:hypothetical protein
MQLFSGKHMTKVAYFEAVLLCKLSRISLPSKPFYHFLRDLQDPPKGYF